MLAPSSRPDRDLSPEPAAPVERLRVRDRARAFLLDRGFVVLAWACAVGLLALVARPLLLGLVPVYGDHGMLFLPLREFYAEALARGESFDWMPQLLSGHPTAGTELGPYHPARFLSYRLLRVDVAYALEMFAPPVFWLVGLQRFLGPAVGHAAAAFAALLGTFSYALLQWLQWPHAAAILAHIPWVLWSMRLLERGRPAADKRLGAGVLALLIGSQHLLAHPQTLWFALLTTLAYTACLAATRRLDGAGLVALAAAQCVGATIGAAQTYAMYAALEASTRNAADPGLPFFGRLRPADLLSTLLPAIHWGRHWTGGGAGKYLGIVPLALCLSAFGVLRGPAARDGIAERPRPWLAWFGAGLAVFATWMALGYEGYLYRLQALLPAIGKLRGPARFTVLTHLGLIVVAAVVLGRLFDGVRNRTPVAWSRLVVPWTAASLTLALGVYAHFDDPATELAAFQAHYLTGPALLCAATIALTLAARGRVLGLYALLAVALFELVSFGLLDPTVARFWRDDTRRWVEWLEDMPRPPDARPGRIYSRDFFGSQLLLADAHFVNGYAGGLQMRRALDYRRTEALRVASAAWVFHRDFEPAPAHAGITHLGRGWYAVPEPLPRVRLVKHVRQSRNPARDLAQIDVATTALVRRRVTLFPMPRPGTVRVIQDRPGRMTAEVTAHGLELLVFAETFDRNWRARVDGERVAVERVNGDFMGCLIEPGAHRVVFEYRPRRLWRAEEISIAGAVLAGLLVAAGLIGRGRRALTPPVPS